MTHSPSRAIAATIAALEDALREIPQPHMLVGGIAVIARGVPRATRDVDAVVWADGLDLEALIATLQRHDIATRTPEAIRLARENQVLFLQHRPSGTPLEILLAWLPFELEALLRAERLALGAVEAPVAQAEDLILYKAAAWQDRDRDDVERLLVLHGGRIDIDRVRALVAEFAEALDEPERVREFEAILRRARGAP
jgi:hypothetical protein